MTEDDMIQGAEGFIVTDADAEYVLTALKQQPAGRNPTQTPSVMTDARGFR